LLDWLYCWGFGELFLSVWGLLRTGNGCLGIGEGDLDGVNGVVKVAFNAVVNDFLISFIVFFIDPFLLVVGVWSFPADLDTAALARAVSS
jgi:hypothetical protein